MRPAGPRLAALVVGLATVLAGTLSCSSDGEQPTLPPSTPTATPSEPATATGDPTATTGSAPPSRPRVGACYLLTLEDALAATSEVAAGNCSERHTTRTYLVGDVDAVVDGHLLAIDSDLVQAQVADICPRELPSFLGGGLEAQRLSVLRPVWFTPTLAESDAGAGWFRCDVVAVDQGSGSAGLAPLGGRLRGVLGTEAGRQRWGLCGTGAPDAEGSLRVPCAADHSWRAVEVVELGAGKGYPGEDAARRAGQDRCEAVGRERAEDPLAFEWGYEWPTREQWESGQTYGRCWVPR